MTEANRLKPSDAPQSIVKESFVSFLKTMIGKNDAGVRVTDNAFLDSATQAHVHLKARLGFYGNAEFDQLMLNDIRESRIGLKGERANALLKTAERAGNDEHEENMASPLRGGIKH